VLAKMQSSAPQLGVAYSKRTPLLIESYPDLVDYVEIPYELLRFDPAVAEIRERKPIVLHCASLSVAGTIRPPHRTLEDVRVWVDRTDTPWLGEHLSFITAERDIDDAFSDAYAPGEPWNIGYTVSPQLSENSLRRVTAAIAEIAAELPVPLILENPPIYFHMPGSTMSQLEFIDELCRRCDVGLLLDLAHFYITSKTLNFDPVDELEHFPLSRVVEVHISGVDEQQGMHWDNHAVRAPQVELDMLAMVLERVPVRAVTLEYNWSSAFPDEALLNEFGRVQDVLGSRREPAGRPN
jgi:uncharacterized protein (UPF0276 family)